MADTGPLISCLMLTGLPGREAFAQAAVKSFVQQDYSPRELVIINHSAEPAAYRLFPQLTSAGASIDSIPVLREPGFVIYEFSVPRASTLGDLRNLALSRRQGTWTLAWDDDDWSHPERLSTIYKTTRWLRKSCEQAVLPTTRIHYSFATNTAFVGHNARGWDGLMFFPRKIGQRYSAREIREDSEFARRCFPAAKVWDNRATSHHYLRFHHGTNVSSHRHICGSYADPSYRNRWIGLPPVAEEYLAKVLSEEYGQAEQVKARIS